MSLFTRWLNRLRQMISNASQPEPVPTYQPVPLLPRLYPEEQVQALCQEKIQEGKAIAYEEMAGNAGNLYWWRRGKQSVTDKLQRILLLPERAETKLLLIQDQCITTEAYTHNQLPGFNPYQEQGETWEQYRMTHDKTKGPTLEMRSVAPPSPFHRAHFEPFTLGHAALPTEREDRFTL